jgi:signal peptidase I
MVEQAELKSPMGDARAAALCARLLREGFVVRLRLGGGSMRPFLRHGECCVIKPTRRGNIEVGTIVAYLGHTGNLTVHRTVAIRRKDGRRGFLVKGDMTAWREWVAEEDMLGRVVGVERNGKVKRLDTAFERSSGKIVALLSPIISFAGAFVLTTAGFILQKSDSRES